MNQVKDAISWATLGAKLLGFLQAIIPAFLVAWVEVLRSQKNRGENLLDYERLKRKTEKKRYKQEGEFHGKTDSDILNDVLSNDDSSSE